MERHVAGALLWYLVWATLYAPNNPNHSRKNAFPLGKVGMGLFGMVGMGLFGMAGMGLLDKASAVGLVSNLCALFALIIAIIVRIAAF